MWPIIWFILLKYPIHQSQSLSTRKIFNFNFYYNLVCGVRESCIVVFLCVLSCCIKVGSVVLWWTVLCCLKLCHFVVCNIILCCVMSCFDRLFHNLEGQTKKYIWEIISFSSYLDEKDSMINLNFVNDFLLLYYVVLCFVFLIILCFVYVGMCYVLS